MDRRPVAVRENLDLDVARTLDVALAEHAAVAEARLGLPARRLEGLLELVGRAHDAHPAAATSRGCLDDQRVADLVRLPGLDDRDAGLACEPLGLELVTGRSDRLGAWPHEDEPRRVHGLGEVAVLRQEAVAGVDRVGARLLRGADDLLRVEIREHGDRLVRLARVERALVVRRVDGHGLDPQAPAGAEDPRGDLAAVRHEEFSDRHGVMRPRRARSLVSGPSGHVRKGRCRAWQPSSILEESELEQRSPRPRLGSGQGGCACVRRSARRCGGKPHPATTDCCASLPRGGSA